MVELGWGTSPFWGCFGALGPLTNILIGAGCFGSFRGHFGNDRGRWQPSGNTGPFSPYCLGSQLPGASSCLDAMQNWHMGTPKQFPGLCAPTLGGALGCGLAGWR